MLPSISAKRENANLKAKKKLRTGVRLSNLRENSILKKREGLSRRSKAHQREVQVLSKGPLRWATLQSWARLGSIEEAQSVSQAWKLAAKVEGA